MTTGSGYCGIVFARPLDVFVRRLRWTSHLVLPLAITACDLLPHPGDTAGVQHAAKWSPHGRIVVDTDPRYTIVRLRADTAVPDGHDVLVARFDFDPAPGVGDEYSIALALDFGIARDLRTNTPYRLGPPPARIPAWGTVTCLCRPLKPDSVRGTYVLSSGGMAQLTGRIDATLYFTPWPTPRCTRRTGCGRGSMGANRTTPDSWTVGLTVGLVVGVLSVWPTVRLSGQVVGTLILA